jgi:3-phosphoshikimate 1-carboxyvinyltransferase
LIGGLAASGPVTVTDTACIATSFPSFLPLLERVARR